MSLGKTLREIRAVRGDSLRDVEEKTGISNAYLSQLERGDAQKPSPDKLQLLAQYYDVPYTDLMRAAGYLQKSEKPGSSGAPKESTSAIQAALMSAKFTPEEEAQIVKFIEFVRFQNKK